MPALRIPGAFARTPPLSLPTSSFSALCRSPTRARFLPEQPLSLHPTISSKRSFITVIENYERGLVFRSGKHAGEKDAGIRWSFPVFNEVRIVDMRTRTMQIPSQELMTKDNVAIHVDAVAFYKVEDPLKAICNIEDYTAAVNEAAQVCASLTALRNPALSRGFCEARDTNRQTCGRPQYAISSRVPHSTKYCTTEMKRGGMFSQLYVT